jgi:hypothetical protein
VDGARHWGDAGRGGGGKLPRQWYPTPGRGLLRALLRSAAILALAQPFLRLFQPLTLTCLGAWAGVWQFLGQKLLAVLMGGCIFSHVCQVAPRELINTQ